MTLVATIPTWRDGAALEAAIASVVDHVDGVYVVDGVIDGATTSPYPIRGSDEEELRALELRYGDQLTIVRCGRPWDSQAAKGNAMLELARGHGRGADDPFVLVLDADEELHNGEKLRSYLGETRLNGYTWHQWRFPVYPIPFEVAPGQVVRACFKLLRAHVWEYVARWSFAQTRPGESAVPYFLGAEQVPVEEVELAKLGPWLSHHPERRPAGRADIRLSEVEAILASPPTAWLTYPMPPHTLPAAITDYV